VGAGLHGAVDAAVRGLACVSVGDGERHGDMSDHTVHNRGRLVSNSIGHEVKLDAGVGSLVDGAHGHILASWHLYTLQAARRGSTVFPSDAHSLRDADGSKN